MIITLLAILLSLASLFSLQTLPAPLLTEQYHCHFYCPLCHHSQKQFNFRLVSCPICKQSFFRLTSMLFSTYLCTNSLILFFINQYLNWHYFSLIILSYFLISLSFIDFYYRYLQDTLTLPLLWLGLLFNLCPTIHHCSINQAILGAVIGYCNLRLINLLFTRARNKQGLGGGDIKLFAALGAWFGLNSLPNILFIACLLGLSFSLAQSLYQHRKITHIAFGPFLSLAVLCYYSALFNNLIFL
ncbi:prepilin peptidase [Piscirickettsia salmonis]|uniref:prepilin peptidase n=1 Tax=Piscirickettsia salmonis TaxID=1238 RepID=UPI0012B8822B|nr:A24 family peptidase [Piscirickettsia salmonis]QGP14239.1 Pectic enzymes secretion protein OutO [Piscirickettsia salmonis]QGP17727.1 Pectic enzymes secretion protein OutO [Piscirickettsia salmonis]QHS26937.1 prepilin peptidase [Piscirickettsia salmonis]